MYLYDIKKEERELLNKAKLKALKKDSSIKNLTNGFIVKLALKKYLEGS